MSTSIASNLPLAGVKVMDFGQYIAGPAVAMVLADLGATVVHVDPPGGPMWRSPANATLHRNKLIVTLDLKAAEGLEQALALIEECDIVIESFRPGVMKRLGIDFDALRLERPELITLSIPGFASNDELRREWRAFESVIAANSGVFTDMGLNRVLMGVNPSFSPLPLASAYGTMLAASATVLALQARERTGLGDSIEVPLACALMEGLCYNSIKIDDYPERYKTQREKDIERRRIEGLPMNLSYDELQELLDPFFRNYKCKDGRMFYVVCPSHKDHAKRCLKALGIYDELVAEGLTEEEDTYLPTDEWQSDVSLGVYPLPKNWADRIAEKMKAVFLTRTTKEWEKIFGRGRFPGAPQRWLQEWIHDDHAEVTGLMIEVNDPEFGLMTQPGPLVWLSGSADSMLSPQPRRWVGYGQALAAFTAMETKLPRVRSRNARDGWLEGVRILDLCNVIAGPHSVGYLARFGADIIKLDPSRPFYDCWNTIIYGLSHMRSKRSVLTDISQPEGRAILEKLVASSDVVVWNATDQQVARMGLTEADLKAMNPNIIFCQLDCFSGVRPGPRSQYLGYDDLVQATTGVMLRFGGGMDTPEEHAHVGTIDVMCGFAASLGIAVALYQQLKRGKAERVKTSLAALSGLAQIPFCYDFERRDLFDEPSGPMVTGYDDLSRFYMTADGFVLLSAYESDLPKFALVEGLEGLVERPVEGRAEFLATAFMNASAEDWVTRLQAADIASATCQNLDALRAYNAYEADDSTGTERGSYSFSVYRDHPSGHTITQLDPYAIRPMRGKIYPLTPAEQYGTSTCAVLSELGYDQAGIEALLDQGVIATAWSRHYLPT
ncbi:MAG: CoA transferase [Natronospirillum sp.]|uniref:CoA transferase n=1 Tax=Natronospirillum sp. TaxID=2812955 RepID=UPI0025E1DF6B|nr:CoA transferase [Natronospirillum sp.]MCH8551456.1 CoA transferase [Natronospirillum sp.]